MKKLLSIVVLFALTGCGYALVGRGSNLPEDVRRVYVAPLENKTQRSQVDQFLTRAIADEMVTRQRFTIVAGIDEADASLTGSVIGFTVLPVSFDNQGRATQYEISITANMLFERTGEPEEVVLWANDRYLFRQSYDVDVSDVGYFDREDEAIEETAMRFAETMVSDLLEGF